MKHLRRFISPRQAPRHPFTTLSPKRRWPRACSASIALLAILPIAHVEAADGTWNGSALNGLWSTAGNWNGGIVANGLGFAADFNTQDLLTDQVVQLDSTRTIGRLIFGDSAPLTPAGWLLDNNATPGNILTLEVATGAPTITVNDLGVDKSAAINLVLAGSQGLTKAGIGTLVLNGTNTYAGGTVVNGGVLAFGSAAAMPGTGANVTVNSGAVAANFAIDQAFLGRIVNTSAGVIALGADSANPLDFSDLGANLSAASLGAIGTFAFNGTLLPNGTTYRLGGGGGNLTLNAGSLIGGNSLLVSDGGAPASIVTLASANTYSGGTTINSGTLQLGNATSAGTGAITLNGGTLGLSASVTIANNVVVAANSAVVGATGNNVQINGNITGSAVLNVTVPAGRTFTLGANNNAIGGFTGTIALGTSAGTLRFQSGGTTGLTLGSSTATFDLGSGSATLRSRNNGSTINLGALTGGSGTILRANSNGTGNTTFVIGGNNASTTFAGSAQEDSTARALALTKVGTGTLTLTGTNTYTGPTVINDGTLQIGDGGVLGTLGAAATVTVLTPGTLAFSRSDDVVLTTPTAPPVPIVISGTGGLKQIGPGKLILTGAHTYSGLTTITGGTLQIGDGGTMGALGATSGVVNDGTLAFNRADAVTFSPVISGSGGVRVLNSTGTVTLVGANTYTGPTAVEAGTLLLTGSLGNTAVTVGNGGKLTGGGAIGGTVTLNSGGQFSPGNNGIATLNLGGLTLNSGSILNLEFDTTPANDRLVLSTLNGLTVNGGGVNLFTAGGTDPWVVPGTYNLIQYTGSIGGAGISALSVLNAQPGGFTYNFDTNGGFVRVTINAPSLSNSWNVDASAVWSAPGSWSNNVVPAAGSTVTFPAVITAPRTVTLDGSRTAGGLNFNSPQSYTITAQAGSTLTLNAGGGAPVPINVTVGNHTLGTPVALNGNLAAAVGGGSSLTVSGVISQVGTAAVVKTGNGLLVLSGNNSYSGGTQINGGAVQITTVGNLGTGGVIFDGGGLRWAPGSSADVSSRTLRFNAGGATLDTNGNDVSFANPIGNGGAGGLTKIGAGTLNLSGVTNSYTGLTSFNGGAVLFDNLANFGTGDLAFNGGTLRWAAGSVTDISSRVVTLNAGGAILDTNGNNVTLASPFGGGGTGGLTKTGTGILTLSSPHTYTGPTTISGGTLAAGSFNAFQVTDTVTIGAAGTLDLVGTTQTLNNLGGTGAVELGGGTLELGAANLTTTFAGGISGTGTFRKVNNGTLLLTGTSNSTAAVNVAAGILQIEPGGSLTAGALTMAAVGGAQFSVHGGAFTSLTRSVVNGASAGFLIDGGTAAFNAGITTTGDANATIRVSGGTFTASDFSIGRNGGAPPVFNSGFIVGGGTATVGTIGLGTANSTGAMSIEGGNLTVSGAITVANQVTAARGGAMRILSGTLTSTDAVDGLVLVKNNGVGINQVASATFTGGVSTLERITFGFDAAVAAGSTATLTLNGGTLYLGSGGISMRALSGNLTSTINLTSGVLGAKADWTSTLPMTLTSASTVEFKAADASDVAHQITLDGPVVGPGPLIKTGGGTLVLSGDNSYSGGTTIAAGSLQVGRGGVSGNLGDSAGVVTNNGILTFDRSDNALVVDNLLTGSGAVQQNGVGTTTLSGDNTYGGGTMIIRGLLRLINATGSGTGSGPVVVKTGGALGGTGRAGGAVTVESGGALAPGSGIGTLTVNSLTLSAGSLLNYEFNGSAGDVTTVTGGLTINGGGVNLVEENTSNPWRVAGSYNLLQFGTVSGAGTSALSVLNGDPARYSYTFATSGNVIRLNVAVLSLPNSWNVNSDGLWSTATNWVGNAVPPASAVANFPGIITQPRTTTLDGSRTVAGLEFSGSLRHTIAAGTGSLTLNNGANPATISVRAGSHTISAPLLLTASGSELNIAGAAQTLTIAGNIGETAPAALAKSGPGALVLGGNNSYSGGTVLNSGLLAVHSSTALGTGRLTINGGTLGNSSGAAVALTTNNPQTWNDDLFFAGPNDLHLGSGPVTLNSSRQVNVSAGNLTVGGAIAGTGSHLTKNGAGTLTLSGASSYNGETLLAAGRLNLNSAAAIGTGALTIQGGSLGNTSGAAVTLAGGVPQIWNADIIFDGPNDLDLGTGAVTLNASRQVTVNAGTLAASSVAGAGFGLTKSGPGVLNLKGTSSYTGATSVGAGSLLVSGQISGTTGITVESGATLGGGGTITTGVTGSVVLMSGALLQPGGGVGLLAFNLKGGSLDLTAPGIAGNLAYLKFDLGTLSDKVAVDPLSALNIGFGSFDLDDFVFTDSGGFGPGTYTLFDTDMPIVGTLGFNTTGTVLNRTATLSMAGNDLVLVVVPEPSAIASLLAGAALLIPLRRRRSSPCVKN